MPNTTVYSFADVSMVISHPSVGQFIATGQGIGTASVTMSTERSAHDISADGSVMVSKILGRNGNIVINAQQTSALHKWLLKYFNYVEGATTNEWATAKVIIRSPVMQDMITLTGVSPQKIADKPFQAQGQHVAWTLMAADIQQDVA